MKVLAVYAHPVRESFNSALLRETVAGLTCAGHDVRVADLCAEGFRPAMVEADFVQFSGGQMPPEVIREQQRVEWSDAIVFVFPIWWWSIPAILKGWFDRVFSFGWAWVDPNDPSKTPLRPRQVMVLATAGADSAAFAKRKYDEAFLTQLQVGTFGYCGFRDIHIKIFYEIHHETPPAVRQACLAEARRLAREFGQTARQGPAAAQAAR